MPRLLVIILLLGIAACSKSEDPSAPRPGDLNNRFYCNDPEAVNYNWGFPGTPDSALCYYPSDVYAGTYTFTDSVYNGDNSLDSARSLTTYILNFIPLNKKTLAIIGFCGTMDTLHLTVDRVSLLTTIDTVAGFGQTFCRMQDTVSGTVLNSRLDSTENLMFDFTVTSDTAINYHRGTAYKQ